MYPFLELTVDIIEGNNNKSFWNHSLNDISHGSSTGPESQPLETQVQCAYMESQTSSPSLSVCSLGKGQRQTAGFYPG